MKKPPLTLEQSAAQKAEEETNNVEPDLSFMSRAPAPSMSPVPEVDGRINLQEDARQANLQMKMQAEMEAGMAYQNRLKNIAASNEKIAGIVRNSGIKGRRSPYDYIKTAIPGMV